MNAMSSIPLRALALLVSLALSACGRGDHGTRTCAEVDASSHSDADAPDASTGAPCDARLGFDLLQLGTAYADEAYALGIDAECDVLLAGATLGRYAEGAPSEPGAGSDVFVHRLDPNGATRWTRQYGALEDDEVHALAWTSTGSVVVVGTTYGAMPGAPYAFGGADAYAFLVDSNGDRRWMRQFGSLEDDFALDLAIFGDGDVLVAGSTNENLVLAHEVSLDVLDGTNGRVVERRRYGSGATDRAEALSIARDGTVHVVGATLGDFGADALGSFDLFTMRIGATSFDLPRVHQRGTTDIDAAVDVAVGHDGEVYVAAVSHSDLITGTYENDGIQNGFVLKFDGTGTLLWIRRVGPADARGSVTSIVVDELGDVYVVGRTDGDVAATNAGGYDVLVTRFGADGTRLGARQFGSVADDTPRDLAVTRAGDVVVAGSTRGDLAGAGSSLGELDAFVARLDRSSFVDPH